jgi:hypothetical protein
MVLRIATNVIMSFLPISFRLALNVCAKKADTKQYQQNTYAPLPMIDEAAKNFFRKCHLAIPSFSVTYP